MKIVAPSPRNNNKQIWLCFDQTKISFGDLIVNYIQNILGCKLSFLRLVTFWYTSCQIQNLLEPRFLIQIKRNTLRNDRIINSYCKVCLIGSNCFLCVVFTNTKYWNLLVLIWLISDDVLQILMKDVVSDVAMRFDDDTPLDLH